MANQIFTKILKKPKLYAQCNSLYYFREKQNTQFQKKSWQRQQACLEKKMLWIIQENFFPILGITPVEDSFLNVNVHDEIRPD